jgi:hypothetical protein
MELSSLYHSGDQSIAVPALESMIGFFCPAE